MGGARWTGVCFLLLMSASAHAALRFGLGSAVAKRSAQLINNAGATDPTNAVGQNVAATLPACPAGALYDSLPTDLSQIAGIVPLGNRSPSPHTFPADHIYLYASTSTVVTPPVYAPGTVHITNVIATTYLSAAPVFTDYAIYFYACKDVKSYYGHVQTLSPALQSQLGGFFQNCTTYTTGGRAIRSCNQNVNIVVQSGELLGNAASTGALDFGSYDYRGPALDFANPSRHAGGDQPYTVCPIDYFHSGLEASMEAMLGRYDGGFHRVIAPVCGGIAFDIAGTARGDWYHPGSPDMPEDPHLSLVPDNVYADELAISIGTSVMGQPPSNYTFTPASSGHVDRDFSEVTADGTVYCYDSFFDPLNFPASGAPSFIVQMPTANTLKIERQSATSCGAGPWSFSSNATVFQR